MISPCSPACLRHPESLTYSGRELIYLRGGDTMLYAQRTG